MIIDTEDPSILTHLNPVEMQMLRNITQRIGILARERIERAQADMQPHPRPLRVEWSTAE